MPHEERKSFVAARRLVGQPAFRDAETATAGR